MLPLITSLETIDVMEWINADEERRRCWRERARHKPGWSMTNPGAKMFDNPMQRQLGALRLYVGLRLDTPNC